MLRLPFSLCAGRKIYILNCSFIKLSSDYWDLPISSLWQCDYLTAAKWYLFLITSQCSKIMISSHEGIHFSPFFPKPLSSSGCQTVDHPAIWLTQKWFWGPTGLKTWKTWAPNKGLNPPPWCQRRYGKEEQNRSFMTSIVALNHGCFLHILPSCRQHPAEQTERKISGKARNKLSDLGGFVEQHRGTPWKKSKMPSLLLRKTKLSPVVLASVVVPIFNTIKSGWASFGGFAAQRPWEWCNSQEMLVFCSQTEGFSLITDFLHSV